MPTRLIENLKKAKGWSANIRLQFDIKDSDGELIQTVWIQPLTRKIQNDLQEVGSKDLSLRMLIKSLYDSEKGGGLVFEPGDLTTLKREVSHFMLNELEMAMINAGKVPAEKQKEFVEDEKKD